MPRIVQAVLLVMGWVALLGLEMRIRLGGGPGVFIETSPPALLDWAGRLLAIHIVGALATYVLWTWLVVASWRRSEGGLPGRFSRRHRGRGTAVFGGLCFPAASASCVFTLASCCSQPIATPRLRSLGGSRSTSSAWL